MIERTLVAHIIICDGVASSLCKQEDPTDISKLNVTDKMISYCRSASRNIATSWRKKTLKPIKVSLKKKKSSVKNDILKEKADQKVLENTIVRLRNEAKTLSQRAEDE